MVNQILKLKKMPDPMIQQESASIVMQVIYACIATFIINLPFGYLRGGFRKLSFWWLIAIHAPVPLVIIIRKFFALELSWELAPFLLGSFFLGQYVGRLIYDKMPYRKK